MDDARAAFLEARGAGLGAALGRVEIERIGVFVDLLATWNRRIHLTGERDPDRLLRKHVVDSLACVPSLPEQGSVLDLGTGAGFPGIILGCLRPDLDLVLLDSRRRPINFLREAIRILDLPRARTLLLRAEHAVQDADLAGRQLLVTSRALRMETFLVLAAPLLAPRGVAISMQTPRVTAQRAGASAERAGLEVARLSDYELPDGELRRLVVCRRK